MISFLVWSDNSPFVADLAFGFDSSFIQHRNKTESRITMGFQLFMLTFMWRSTCCSAFSKWLPGVKVLVRGQSTEDIYNETRSSIWSSSTLQWLYQHSQLSWFVLISCSSVRKYIRQRNLFAFFILYTIFLYFWHLICPAFDLFVYPNQVDVSALLKQYWQSS